MAIEFTGFEASKIFEPQWATFNDLDADLARIGQVVTAGAGDRTVDISAGSTRIKGVLCQITGSESRQATANGSGNSRVDALIWRVDWGADTATLVIKAGTPAGNPQPPALTQQVNNLWEEPIAHVRVGPGQGAFTSDDITPVPARAPTYVGWQHISSGTHAGGAFSIPVTPSVYSRLRLSLRGHLDTVGTVRLRINGDSTGGLHRTSIVGHRGDGGTLAVDAQSDGAQQWILCSWAGTAANNCVAELFMTDSAQLVGYHSVGGRMSSGIGMWETRAHGRLNQSRLVSSLNVRPFSDGLNQFNALRWWLEGYRLP